MASSFRLARAALALLALSFVPSASAALYNTVKLTNGSQFPLLGIEVETMEAGNEVPARRSPVFLPGPLMPGQSTSVEVAVDEALVARGGQQRVRFYWSSGRECSAYLTVNPKGGPGVAHTGDRLCKDNKVPSSAAVGLAAKSLVAKAIAERGDPVGAIFEYNALIAAYGEQESSLQGRGELYAQVGRLDLAEADFRAEAGINSDAGHAYHDQAILFYGQGKGDHALASLSSAIAHSPENSQYLRDRAFLYCMAGERERMRQDEAAAAALGDTRQPPLGPDCTLARAGTAAAEASTEDDGW